MNVDLRRLFDRDPRPDPCEPTEVVHRDDLVLWHRPSATRSPWASGVLHYRWTEASADRGIDEVLSYFAARDAPFTWHVPDDGQPSDLGARLRARGFILEAQTDMLVADLPIVGLRINPAIGVVDVTNERTLRDSVLVQHPDWDDERRDRLLRERRAYLGCAGHLRHFALAYLDGRPIASARWRFSTRFRAIGLSGAETLPAYQNRGAYSTLVDYRARIALARGCQYVTILADVRMSAPILRKRGFASVGTAEIYVWPETRSSSS